MSSAPKGVTVVNHPLVQHKLTLMRDKGASTRSFRQLLREIAGLIAYEVTRDLPTRMVDIETPLAPASAPVLAGKKLVFAAVLRSGVEMVEGMLELAPAARVGHIGLYRNPASLGVVEYYFRMPADLEDRLVIVVDPMLATGNTAVAAVDRLKEAGARSIRVVCLLAAPEGLARLLGEHPDVAVWTAAVDERLDEAGYIIPGVGDAGDRMFGTKEA